MNKKIKKFVYYYSKNSRLKNKELGKQLKASQQSTSYLISSLRKKKIILDYNTIIDPAKFGLLTIIVYYNFKDFSSKAVQEIISYLKEIDEVVGLELFQESYDLACTFSVPNLSHFNKLSKEILQNLSKELYTAEIFPVVVKHLYPKKYLSPRKLPEEIIICGDRDLLSLSENQQKVLYFLYQFPNTTIINLANSLNLNPKTAINCKRSLENSKVVRGYTVLWNHQKLDLTRKKILLDSENFNLQDDKRILTFSKTHPNIISLTRLIGKYDILLEVEGEDLSNKDVLKDLRSEFNLKEFKVVYSKELLKEKYINESTLKIKVL